MTLTAQHTALRQVCVFGTVGGKQLATGHEWVLLIQLKRQIKSICCGVFCFVCGLACALVGRGSIVAGAGADWSRFIDCIRRPI